jgi:4-hydroxy-tetrahydrodipicolinate reductase
MRARSIATLLKVGVIGARGRMGSEVCRVVEEDPELDLVARVDRDDPLQSLVDSGAEVAVEFSEPASVKANTLFCLEHGIHAVVGATGLDASALAEIEAAARANGANAFVAPNFALGAVLMMKFAAEAAGHYDRAEIIERHHDKKLDAPSGTALRTARLMNEARGDEAEIPIHSVRLPGLVAHQEVIFGGPGETLTIKHDSLDRASFMPGVLLAVKRVASLPPLTVGLEHLIT